MISDFFYIEYNIPAILKYTAKPNKSLKVVINGPEAKAGLIPNLSKTKGVIVPITEASITTKNKAIETTKASLGGCLINKINKITIEQITKAFIRATIITRQRRFSVL